MTQPASSGVTVDPSTAATAAAGPSTGAPATSSTAGRRSLIDRVLPHRGGRFASLDGFRAIAAFGVVLYHVAGNAGLTRDGSFASSMLGNLGNFGVAVFFLLSGFLLYRPFVAAHLTREKAPGWASFYWNRLIRILPGYWLALTAFLLLVGLQGGGAADRPFDHYLTLYTLTQVYRPSFGFSALTVAWTLCIEVAFYLALPPIAFLIRYGISRGARSPRAAVQGQLIGLGILVLITWIYRATVVSQVSGGKDNQHLWLPNYFDWFALGMAMAVATVWADLGHRLPRVLRVLSNTPWVCWMLSLWTYAVLALLRGTDSALVTGSGKETTADAFVRFTFNGFSALFLLLPGIVGTTRQSGIRRVMSTALPAYLGTISYGVYLWHKLWLDWLKPEGAKDAATVGLGGFGTKVRELTSGVRDSARDVVGSAFVPLLLGVILLTVLAASASYFGWEKPLLRFKHSAKRS